MAARITGLYRTECIWPEGEGYDCMDAGGRPTQEQLQKMLKKHATPQMTAAVVFHQPVRADRRYPTGGVRGSLFRTTTPSGDGRLTHTERVSEILAAFHFLRKLRKISIVMIDFSHRGDFSISR